MYVIGQAEGVAGGPRVRCATRSATQGQATESNPLCTGPSDARKFALASRLRPHPRSAGQNRIEVSNAR